MINFKFVKSQFRIVWIPIVIFGILALILLIPAFIQNRIPFNNFWKEINRGHQAQTNQGAGPMLNYLYFGLPGFAIMFSLSIILSHILISKEIDQGYLASWLTIPMSRRTIISSKLFILLISMLSISFIMILVQLCIFPFTLKDFDNNILGRLFLINFDFIFVIIFFASINWVISNIINKSSYSISIISGMAALQLFGQLLDMPKLTIAKYFTITGFFNSGFQFSNSTIEICLPQLNQTCPGDYLELNELLPIKTLDYAWQMPLMTVLIISFFVLGSELMVKKDLYL